MKRMMNISDYCEQLKSRPMEFDTHNDRESFEALLTDVAEFYNYNLHNVFPNDSEEYNMIVENLTTRLLNEVYDYDSSYYQHTYSSKEDALKEITEHMLFCGDPADSYHIKQAYSDLSSHFNDMFVEIFDDNGDKIGIPSKATELIYDNATNYVEDKNGKKYGILKGSDICKQMLYPESHARLSQLMNIDSKVFGGDSGKGEDCAYVGDITGYANRFGYIDCCGHPFSLDSRYGEQFEEQKAHLNSENGVVDNIIAITDPDKDDKIIGYINYLTMGDDLFKEITDPTPEYIQEYINDPEAGSERRDDGISGAQLKPWTKEGENNLFILTIAIDPEYQDGEAIKILTNSFLDEMREKQAAGYDVTSISADTVSDHGEDAMKMFRCTNCIGSDGKPVILPAPPSDESGHDVTVRICKGEDMQKLLSKGFDLERERTGVNKKVSEDKPKTLKEEKMAEIKRLAGDAKDSSKEQLNKKGPGKA